jgi:hypothetical protein
VRTHLWKRATMVLMLLCVVVALSITCPFVAVSMAVSYTIWPSTTTPTVIGDPDTDAVELGAKFQSNSDGFITGIRFYKASTSTGTHVGNLWTRGGTRLATATFTNETASGWQYQALATPVSIIANTTYIVSYHTNVGHYSFDDRYFSTSGYDNGTLRALGDGEDGSNGVYRYGSVAFPNLSWQSRNYWVDVVFSPTSSSDTTAPKVELFSIPSAATSLTVSITGFTATDGVGVTGYMVTESSTAPLATSTGWSATAPTSYTFTSAGTKTLYAWAKDAAGNVSASKSASVAITLAADTTPPTVTFTLPGTASTLTVTFTQFTATDDVGVTGYMVTESSTAPLATSTGWSATAPTSYTFTSAGTKTLYAWAKDAAGNVSARKSASVTITLPPDTTPPAVTFFLPGTASTLTVTFTQFTATDNVGVTGYMVKTSSTNPLATSTGWLTTAPTSYTFPSTGTKTLYAWAKDAAGNVSTRKSASVTITLSTDTTPPTVTLFRIPVTASAPTVPIVSFTATDNVRVTGYMVTESSTAPSATSTGWLTSAPTSYTFPSAGTKTLYAWVKDAAGNVSSNKNASVIITLQSFGLEPLVAIHVSEITQALETIPATPPTPLAGPDSTGYEWAYTSWHYFVAYESLKEALRSDGTPFIEISDADIASGNLLYSDGSPRYPILISLASEAISDAEITPLRSYVNAGGFLFVGSSAFTRNPNGTLRGDFALADEMGVHITKTSFWDNWDENITFTKTLNHPLVTNIPSGTLIWRMPLASEEIPTAGLAPDFVFHGNHFIWQVRAAGATVIANGASTPLLTTKNYGKGTFIYHSVSQPLIGHGGDDSGMYAYLIYRNAIKWAFESAKVPIIRLSPWRFQYDATFVVRHDFENYADMIRSIETSASFESSVGAKGDYYFCTGTLRDQMQDKTTVVSSLRRAVSTYGATVGSHNGGLKHPLYPSLSPSDYNYWHWGPDQALDASPPGYADGQAYAEASIAKSFQDIESWLSGLDNGRSGCGTAGTCPRIWVSPLYDSTREASYDLLETLAAVTVGEQKVGPFPHWTVSTQTAGKRYEHLTLPVSEWYAGEDTFESLEEHSLSTMRAAVDFYYSLGALINIYGHNISKTGTVQGEYVKYAATKPRVWAANSVKVYDWWRLRSPVSVTPVYTEEADTAVVAVIVNGAIDADTAIEILTLGRDSTGTVDVLLNGSPATPNDYRITDQGSIRIRVGATVSSVEVSYPLE